MSSQEECSSGSGEDDREKVKEGAGRVVDALILSFVLGIFGADWFYLCVTRFRR